MGTVVTSPVLFPLSLKYSSRVYSSLPSPGLSTLITPLLTLTAEAIAVAAAAESVTEESAE